MGKFNIVEGDLIELALDGSFDVIAHGCNCYNIQGKGIALQMDNVFKTSSYTYEQNIYHGDINKLGIIDYNIINNDLIWNYKGSNNLFVVNAYTQFGPGPNLDYNALTLCLRKINHIFKGKHIGLPKVGCGLAGGIWDITAFSLESNMSMRKSIELYKTGFKDVKTIIQEELKDMDITIVDYKK